MTDVLVYVDDDYVDTGYVEGNFAPIYFDYPQSQESSFIWLDNKTIETASNGSTRIKYLQAKQIREFNVVHILNKNYKNNILTFYNQMVDSKNSFTFIFTLANTGAINCRFKNPPVVTLYSPDSLLYKVTCTLIEV